MSFQSVESYGDKFATSISIFGPSGSGKSLSALRIARGLVGDDGRIAVFDTEDKMRKFRRITSFDLDLELTNYNPDRCIKAINDAVAAKYDCLIIDSFSPWWDGPGGVLSIKDDLDAKGGKEVKTQFGAWPAATKIQNKVITAIKTCQINLICTMRSKTKWEIVKDHDGRTRNKRIGLQPIQREQVEYEFDFTCEIDPKHNLEFLSTRCLELDGTTHNKPDEELGAYIAAWLINGVGMSKEARYLHDIRSMAESKGVLDRFASMLSMAEGDIEMLEEIYAQVKEV